MFSEFEKIVFRRGEREQFFCNGKIMLCDSDDIGRSIVYDDGNTMVVVANFARPCFRVVSPHAVIFKSVIDSRENAVHIAKYDKPGGFTIFPGHLISENEVAYVSNAGEIYRMSIYSGSIDLIATADLHGVGEAILFDDYFSVPEPIESILPYEFYTYSGFPDHTERNKHLGSIILFMLYLYLRNSTKDFSCDDTKKQMRNDLLFNNKALTYERVSDLIAYLKSDNNYNNELGEIFEGTINRLMNQNITNECLTFFFDMLFTIEQDYSEEDKKMTLALDPLGNYFERRYQAEKHHKVGKYFKALDKIANATLLNGNALSMLSDYDTFKKIANTVIDEQVN